MEYKCFGAFLNFQNYKWLCTTKSKLNTVVLTQETEEVDCKQRKLSGLYSAMHITNKHQANTS